MLLGRVLRLGLAGLRSAFAAMTDATATADAAAAPAAGEPEEAGEEKCGGRVKLYVLNAERSWDDKGTGYVRAVAGDEADADADAAADADAEGPAHLGLTLVVRSENDGAPSQAPHLLPPPITFSRKGQGRGSFMYLRSSGLIETRDFIQLRIDFD